MAKKNSKVNFSTSSTAPKPSGGRLPRTPFTVNTLLEDDGDGSGDCDMPSGDISQAELQDFVTVSMDLRRLLERYGVVRRDLVRRLQGGAAVEPGPMSVDLSDMPAAMFQWWLVERALAAVHANYLKGEHLDGELVRLRVTGFRGPKRPPQRVPAASPEGRRPGHASAIADPARKKRHSSAKSIFVGMKDV